MHFRRSDDDIYDLDFANRMMRKKELFEKKQKLALVSHSLLPPYARERLRQKYSDDPVDDFDAYVRGEPYRRRFNSTYRSISPTTKTITYTRHASASSNSSYCPGQFGNKTSTTTSTGALSGDVDVWWSDLMRKKSEAELRGYHSHH